MINIGFAVYFDDENNVSSVVIIIHDAKIDFR